jgi:hypothetical protein
MHRLLNMSQQEKMVFKNWFQREKQPVLAQLYISEKYSSQFRQQHSLQIGR